MLVIYYLKFHYKKIGDVKAVRLRTLVVSTPALGERSLVSQVRNGCYRSSGPLFEVRF